MDTTAPPVSVTVTNTPPGQSMLASVCPDSVPTSPPVAGPPTKPPTWQFLLPTAWPRSAQLVAAVLLVLATVLILIHGLGYLGTGSRPTELRHRVDLNRATHAELLQLPDVGESLARSIEKYREEHGGFKNAEELRKVHGIGPSRMESLRPWVSVDAEKLVESTEVKDRARKGAAGATGGRPTTASDTATAEEHPEVPPYTKAQLAQIQRELTREDGSEDLNFDRLAPDIATSGKASNLKTNTSGKASSSKKAVNIKGAVDINRATAEELKLVPGIGPVSAELIVQERSKKPFQSVDDLLRVPGIKQAKLEQLRPYVTVKSDLSVTPETAVPATGQK